MPQSMPTNDVFHHLCLLLRIHKDKDYIIELFEKQGVSATKSKIAAWQTKSGGYRKLYREMPREALDAFINALHEDKTIIE